VKSLPIASLALVVTLSGCSSSPSIEEQTKLVEYEKCMEWYENMYDREIAVMATEEEAIQRYNRNDIVGRLKKLKFENLTEACKKYRP